LRSKRSQLVRALERKENNLLLAAFAFGLGLGPGFFFGRFSTTSESLWAFGGRPRFFLTGSGAESLASEKTPDPDLRFDPVGGRGIEEGSSSSSEGVAIGVGESGK
jgi:hypothetical protein